MPVEILELLKRIITLLESINQKMDTIEKKLSTPIYRTPPPPRLPEVTTNYASLREAMTKEIEQVKKLKKIQRQNIPDFNFI